MKIILVISFLFNVGLGIYTLILVQPKNEKPKADIVLMKSGEIEAREIVEIRDGKPVVLDAFNWAMVESPDYKLYVENLRKIGCPEPTIRDIIKAELDDLFLKDRQKLTEPFQQNYWELAKSGLRESIEEILGKVEKLKKERDRLLAELLGKEDEIEDAERHQKLQRFADFLSKEKLVKLTETEKKYDKLMLLAGTGNLEPTEEQKEEKREQLLAQKAEDIKAMLSSEEYDEYKLRNSPYAKIGQHAVGFDATEDELRSMARINLKIDEMNITGSESVVAKESERTRDAELKQMLGEDRFADYNRGQNDEFRQIYRVAQRYGLAKDLMVQVDELRKTAIAQADQVRKNKNLTTEQRQEMLHGIQQETEKTVQQTFGTEPAKTYKGYGGSWIDDLGGSGKKNEN